VEGRVAELERELSAMRALLKGRGGDGGMGDGEVDDGGGVESGGYGASGRDGNSNGSEMDCVGASERSSSTQESPAPASGENTRATTAGTFDGQFTDSNKDLDVVDRGRVSMGTATDLVRVYVDHCMALYPAVILPKQTTASELKTSKPVLFLAVIAAAALGWNDPDLSRFLNEEVRRLFADRIFIKGEKSLELVQSLLITVAFYYPPDSPEKLQFYQYIHMAATMAVDIGIGSVPSSVGGNKGAEDEGHMAEISRTILRCYISAARYFFPPNFDLLKLIWESVAARMRRPPMLQFNNWMSDCLSRLEKSPSGLDRRLAAWVRLQRIADEASTSFGFDDPSTSISLMESRMHVIVKAFERRLEDWKKETAPELIDSKIALLNPLLCSETNRLGIVVLTTEYHLNAIFVYEFVMSGGKHDIQDFKKKHFTLIPLDTPYPRKHRPPPSADQINATMKCIDSCHILIEAFLNLDVAMLRTVISSLYVSAAFALLCLLRISFTIGTSDGGIGELIDIANLKIDSYLEAMRRKLKEAEGGPMRCRLAEHWVHVLDKRIQTWHDQHQQQMRESSMERKGDGDEALGFPPAVETDRQYGAQQDFKGYPQDEFQLPAPQNCARPSFAQPNDTTPFDAKLTAQNGMEHNSQTQQCAPSLVTSLSDSSARPDATMEWKSDNNNDDVFLFQNDGLLGDTDLFNWMEDGTLLNDLPGW
jgi:hypothetical protein